MENINLKIAKIDDLLKNKFTSIQKVVNELEYAVGYKESISLAKGYSNQELHTAMKDIKCFLAQYINMEEKQNNNKTEKYPVSPMNSMRLRGMIDGLIDGAKAFLAIDLSDEFTNWLRTDSI